MRTTTALISFSSALALVLSCSEESTSPQSGTTPSRYTPPPETCAPVDPLMPRVFTQCSKGSGSFGAWVLDDHGLPAYEYGLDENADDRAKYPNTENIDRREHWGAFGNARVNAMFFNDGYVEVADQDRGVEYLNAFDASQGAYAGGFSFIGEGNDSWCTAYKYRPKGAETRRRFGMGYGEAITSYGGIQVARTTFAPKGDVKMVIDEVAITNQSSTPRSLRHYEYFDVGRRPIEINWAVSGSAVDTLPADARAARDARNALFDESVDYDGTNRTLALSRSHAAGVVAPPRSARDPIDYYPGNPFLAALVGDVADTFTDQSAFFGGLDPTRPPAASKEGGGEGIASGSRGAMNGASEPRLFVLETRLDAMAPGETRKLRFGYGASGFGEGPAVDASFRDVNRDLLAEAQADIKDKLVYFATDDEPVLAREMAWHAYQMEASVGYREYFDGRVVPQGSAYLYLHGADGAARDLGIFAMPLVYSDPDLAKSELELDMRIQRPSDLGFSYAFQGNGVLDDALGLHYAPSDLDIFFLWALGEYLGATGDLAFFDRAVPFWPKESDSGARVYDHVKAAVRHLFDVVGTGEHGLIRVGTGDWSDGITVSAPDRQLAIEKGESVPNTQMAASVLPRIATLVATRDPAFANEIRAHVTSYRSALASAWTGSFYGRAYYGDGKLVHSSTIDLEAQVWALIGGELATDADRDALVDAIRTQLDEPSPTGAALQPGGMVWPAISGLLTEGYANSRPDLAWAHYKRNTMFAHALAYPDEWYGIWSGPDGLNGPSPDHACTSSIANSAPAHLGDCNLPGGAWYSVVTPMTDFPVQNNNQHAMPLLATIREAGVTAAATGIRVEPKAPGRFTLSTQLVDVAADTGTLTVTYRPPGLTRRTVEIVAPQGEHLVTATLDGSPSNPGGQKSIIFVIDPTPGHAFTITTTSSP